MMQVFDFKDYKLFLKKALNEGTRGGRGAKTLFAKAIQSESSHVTRILNGKAHLTPEQVERTNRYLGHSREESVYFFYLVQFAQAGTAELKKFIEEQIAFQQEQYINL